MSQCLAFFPMLRSRVFAFRWRYSLLLIACSFLFGPAARAQSAPPVLSVGIVPQQAASELARVWIPLLQEVGRRARVQLVFRTASDIPAFEDRVMKGEFDLAYMNPYHYTVFSNKPGYQAFLKEKDRKLVGIIVVPKDSPFQNLEQLQGKRVAFPAPAAFAASILPRAEFTRHHMAIEARFVSSHDSVYKGVASGLFDAGGGIQRTLEAMEPEVSSQLRVLSRTPAYTPHALAIHPGVSAEVAERLRQAFIALDGDEAGRALLAPLNFKGLVAATDSEWDSIRALRLKQPVGSTAGKK